MGVTIDGGSGTQVQVDANGNTKVVLPTTLSQGGYAVDSGDAGAPTDPVVLRRTVYASEFQRKKVGIDQVLFYEYFSGNTALGTGLNQNTLRQITSTMTIGVATGGLVLNNGSSTAANGGALITSYPVFSFRPKVPIEFGFRLKTSAGTGTLSNKVIEIGAYQNTSAVATGILDGVCFRWTSGGALQGVLNVNGTDLATCAIATVPSDSVYHEYKIIISPTLIEFYVDSALVGTLTVQTSGLLASGYQSQQPLAARLWNPGIPGQAPQATIADMWVIQNDEASNRPINTRAAMKGDHASFLYTGNANSPGMTPVITNSTNPSGAGGSNTSGNINGLGGDFAINAPTGAATDYIACDFSNPAIGATTSARTLIVTGVHISCCNLGATVATTPTQLFFGAAWGHTSASLATTDSVTAHAPRRMLLGGMYAPVGAVAGQMYDRDIHITFATPMSINPGEHFAIYVKVPTGTNTGSQVIRGIVGVEGYWE